MKTATILLLLVLLLPSATAQWETTQISDFTGDEPTGVTIEVHPITSSWVIAYGTQNATNGEIWAESSNDEFITKDGSEVLQPEGETALGVSMGGLSTSMTGLAFCVMESKFNGTTTNNDLYLFYNTGITDSPTAGPGHYDWDFNRITDDFNLAGPCDTSLPRYGWRTPPGVALAWVKDPDGTTTNKSQLAMLNTNAQFTRGPYPIGGEFSLGTDSMEFIAVPGVKFESPNYIGSPDKQPTLTESACSNAGFSFAGAISAVACLNLKVIGFAAKTIVHTLGQGSRSQDPSLGKATVDLHTSVTGAGLITEPITQHQVNFRTHTYLRDDNDQGDISIFANRPGLALRASDTTIMEPYNSMTVWHDHDAGEVRYRISDHFDTTGTSQTAFPFENRIQWIRVKTIDPTPIGSGRIIVGALHDNTDNSIQAFWTTDRGKTWQNETVATDPFDFSTQTNTEIHWMTDVAYDPTREKLLVTYPTATNITLATRDLSFEPNAIANPSDLRGLLDDTGTTPPTQEFLGIDLNPIGESSGLGIDGGKMFLALLLILGMMGGTFAIARDGRLCVWIGGGAGLITSLATGLIGTWVLFVMAVFFFGLGQAVHLLDRGADIIRGESLG